MKPLLMLMGLAWALAAHAQEDVEQFEVLAIFDEAHRLAIDARDRLFVVDRGRAVVVQLNLDGTEQTRLGGPGSRDGEFDEPVDIDPGVGLTWLVADAGNGRVQRFSQTFMHIETLVVPRDAQFEPGIPNRLEPKDEQLHGGRPRAVAQSPTGELFVIEESQGIVLKWDKSRRLERAIGGFGHGEGALQKPVALAVDTKQLYVADYGLQAVAVYDLYGGFVRLIARGRATDVRAVTLAQARLWIVMPRHILVAETTGRILHVLPVPEGQVLVDAVPHGAYLYMLSAEALLRTRIERF